MRKHRKNTLQASRDRRGRGQGVGGNFQTDQSTPFRVIAFRFWITFFALVGAGITAYLSYVGFSGGEAVCFSSADGSNTGGGCQNVLGTAWATVGGVPLALFGLIAYAIVGIVAVAPAALRRKDWNKPAALFLVFATTSMAVFSVYLMIGQFFFLDVEGICYYCTASAIITLVLAGLSFAVYGSYPWGRFKPALYASGVALIVTLVIGLPVFTAYQPEVIDGRLVISEGFGDPAAPFGWPVSTTSGTSEVTLAEHLTSQGANMYGAWWCPHCYSQKQLFGDEGAKIIPYVECATGGVNPQEAECDAQGITSYPTWVIGGETFLGVRTLEELALISEYSGPSDFTYTQG